MAFTSTERLPSQSKITYTRGREKQTALDITEVYFSLYIPYVCMYVCIYIICKYVCTIMLIVNYFGHNLLTIFIFIFIGALEMQLAHSCLNFIFHDVLHHSLLLVLKHEDNTTLTP